LKDDYGGNCTDSPETVKAKKEEQEFEELLELKKKYKIR
tara:strand:+ start:303 stop:419 length:117 start_codon:yes stop_codon:yes gene_type:complete